MRRMRRVVVCLLFSLALAQAGSDELFEKARSAQVAGRLGEAEAAYREYLKRYGAKPEVLANLGALLARRENYAEAIRYYQQALRLDPVLAPLHLNLGLAYLKQAQAAMAVREFDLFLKAQPGNRQAMQLRAMALLEAERYPEAEAQYRALLPTDEITVALGLGTALLRRQKVTEARAALEPVLTRADSAEAQLALGQLLLQEGRLDEAMTALVKARQLNPELAHVRVTIGSVLWRQRKTEEALQEWRAECKAHPDHFEALYMLGSALSLNADTRAEAETALRKAVALRPRNTRASYQLAKLVWQTSRNPEALTFLERATQTDPDFREALFLRASVLQALGRRSEAAPLFARVKELSAKDVARQQDLFSESP